MRRIASRVLAITGGSPAFEHILNGNVISAESNPGKGRGVMLSKSVFTCLAAAAFVAAIALMPPGASARAPGAPGAANVPQPGTYKWPPYAEGGNMPQATCGYLWVTPYRHNPRNGQWVYRCH
jgi:hypothetical protein